MRDCKFIVACKNMEFAVQGFLSRRDFHVYLGCRRFAFDPREDLYSARGKADSGLCANGDPILRMCRDTHRHAIVLLDAEWVGSPGAKKIRTKLEKHLRAAGWKLPNCAVVVIDPELENWIWIPHDSVAAAMGWGELGALRTFLTGTGDWAAGGAKPASPKEALERALEETDEPRSSKLYEKILRSVPDVDGCTDGAFQLLRDTLRVWFPPEAP